MFYDVRGSLFFLPHPRAWFHSVLRLLILGALREGVTDITLKL